MRSLSRAGLGLVLAGVCFSLVYAGGLPKKPSQPQEKKQAEQVIEEVDVIEVRETTIIIEEATTWIGTESVWSFRNKMPRTKIYSRFEPSEDKYYLIGISKIDLKGSNPYKRRDRRNVQYLEYDAQIAAKYLDNSLTLRGGIINSGAGLGVDYMLPDGRTSITVEGHSAVYSSPFFLRTNLSYKLCEDSDCYLIAGVEDMLDKPSIIAGVKIEFGLAR
ncbi:hypothetical protein KAI19_01410 [bacterium]|nr:hypothetical protein [bacterium]